MEKMENVNGNRLRHVFSYFIKNQTPNQLHMMRFAWLIEIHNSSLERDVDKCLMHVALLVLKKNHTAVPYAVDSPLKGKMSDIFKPCKAKANFEDLFDLIWFIVFNAIFSYIMVTSFSGGGSRSTRREPPTMGKQLVSFITSDCESSAPFL